MLVFNLECEAVVCLSLTRLIDALITLSNKEFPQ